MDAIYFFRVDMTKELEHIQKIDSIVLELVLRKELRKLWNGVGSDRPLVGLFRPPAWICNLFGEASQFHDVAYWVGGTNEHREISDKEFERRCFDAMLELGWLSRLKAHFWTAVCGDMVRNFGGWVFTLRNEPCYDVDELLKEAQ